MKQALSVFLFGFLAALIIFGFNTPLLPKFQISYSISSSWPEFLTAIGTILAVVVAMSVALWGETLKKIFYRPDMKLIGHHKNRQTSRDGITQGHTRLKFINDGESMAEDVIVYVNAIIDNASPRGEFLPVPLSWTHDGRYWRNFAPHEVWFLDLCRRGNVDDDNLPTLVLAAGAQVPVYEDINKGKTTIEIRLSHKSGQIRDYEIDLFWESGLPYVEVEKISETITHTSITAEIGK